MKTLTALAALWLGCWLPTARAHGRLIEPPSRATAWRYGFDTPHNYNDHELYCGGFSRQWHSNGGKCGVCGDPWDQKPPRAHEYGGKYGRGVVVRKYLIGSSVELRVELTANHNGYFEFRLCPRMENVTQECLDEHPLLREDEERQPRFYPRDGNRIYSMKYKLPAGFECVRCVLQWRYVAGNNWGTCPDGTGAVGCGPQEEFRACADVSVGAEAGPPPPPLPPRSTTPKTPQTTTAEESPTEIPQDTGAEDRFPIGALVCALALFFALLAFALLYLYYYRCGGRIKSLLSKSKGSKAPPPPPRRPPRTRERSHRAPEADCDAEPGFRVVELGDGSR